MLQPAALGPDPTSIVRSLSSTSGQHAGAENGAFCKARSCTRASMFSAPAQWEEVRYHVRPSMRVEACREVDAKVLQQEHSEVALPSLTIMVTPHVE